MSRKDIEEAPKEQNHPHSAAYAKIGRTPFVIYAIAFLLCILMSVTPLLRLAGKTFLLSLPTNPLLLWWSSWIPADLHLAQDYRASMITTNTIEFLLLMALAFVIYGLCALFIQRQPLQSDFKRIRCLIWLTTIIGGLIFVLTPAMLSRDIFVYVGYGRTIATYHANPYFVAPVAFPQDPLIPYDDWKYATAAYGPVWLAICALWSLLIGNAPLTYVLTFRLFAFAAHLVNTLLLATFLRKTGRSSRIVTLGMLLYAWNPLVLQESCLGAHNDTLMVTLMLLGILLCLSAEQQGFARPSHYLLPILAFMLAALVKFTAMPLIAFYLVVLARNTFYPAAAFDFTNLHRFSPQWRPMLLRVLLASMFAGFVAVTFYAPFWIGHNINDIVQSFSSPPSAHASENSLLRAVVEWIKMHHGLPMHNSRSYIPLYVLSQRKVWDAINYVTLFFVLILNAIWVWRVPATRTMVFATLATFGGLFIVTPWFFAWYVTSLVGLAIVCLPLSHEHLGRGLVAFALTFSATAYVTYLFTSYPPLGAWNIFSWLAMIGPPLLVLFFFMARKNNAKLRPLSNNRTMTE